MVDFLKCQDSPEELKKNARPRNPYPDTAEAPMESRFASQDAQAISDLITDLEEDGKGMPVLLRQYLKLGARALAFNDSMTCVGIHALPDCRFASTSAANAGSAG